MHSKMFSFFAIFLLLTSNFSIVFAEHPQTQSTFSDNSNSVEQLKIDFQANSNNAAISDSGSFACKQSSLTPLEAQNIFDEVLNKGFTGAELNSGTKADKSRDNLDQNVLIIPKDGKNAIKAEFPSQKIKPEEVSYLLNTHFSGPFAFGLVLSDTLRVGRCEGLDANSCALSGKNLYYRNSGQGIVGDVKSVWNDFKEIFTKKPSELSEEEYQALQAKFQAETKTDLTDLKDPNFDIVGNAPKDVNKSVVQGLKDNVESLKYNLYTRTVGNPIENSILTSYFDVTSQTNCSNNSCIISTYSMFDKLFNSWLSTNMVLSNFGPTLWMQANKLVGYSVRWGWPWSDSLHNFGNRFRRALLTKTTPGVGTTYDTLLGNAWRQRILQRKDAFGLGPWWTPLMENPQGWDKGFYFHQTAPFRRWWTTEATNPGGILDKLTENGKNKTIAKELYNVARDLRQYANLNKSLFDDAEKAYAQVVKEFGPESDAARKQLIEWAKVNARLMQNNDNLISLDTPEWFARYHYNGLYDVGVEHIGTGRVVPLHMDSHHIDNIMEKFIADGDFENWQNFRHTIKSGNVPYPGNAYKTASADGKSGIQLYRMGNTSEFKEVPITELEKNLAKFKDKVAIIETGEKIPLNDTSFAWIKDQGIGTVKVADGGWEKAEILTPDDFAGKLTHSRIKNRVFNTQLGNSQRMVDTMVERNYVGRKYLSALDKVYSEQDQLIKDYFSLKGGAKWTVAPYGYWWAKKGGGFENLSAYQLPDTWTQLKSYLGADKVFNDAFVDFFANEGSDQGDIFVQVLNKLPWELALSEVAKTYKPVENIYNSLTGRQLRNKVENLAIYTTTQNDCASCSVTVSSSADLKQFSPAFNARNKLTNYLLEDAVSDEAKRKGSTLISYVHHMDLKGKSADIEGQSIDLPKAKQNKETCGDKLKKLGLGWVGSPSRVGAVFGITESLSYAVFGWSGIFASVFQQTVLAPKLQDCVDYDEGYFIHMFVPSKDEKKKSETPTQASTEKVAGLIEDSSKKVLDSLKGDSNSFVGKQADDVKKQIEDLTQTNQKEVVEAIIDTQAKTTGKLSGEELFYFWFKGSTLPSKYKTSGKTNIVDPKSNISVQVDYANGKIYANGKEIVGNPDIARLTSLNADIPAEEIPQNITKIGLSGLDEPLFEMDVYGNLKIKDKKILDCLQQGVKAQTGVGFSTDNLSEAFGKVESIVTNSHPNIFPRPEDFTIVAEGTPREIATGRNAIALIKSNRETLLKSDSGEKKTGLLESIQFKNGVIVYKAETNELIVWLKHNEKAILSQDDVSGLKALKTSITNPETKCNEPAINLQAIATAGSDLSADRVKNFNDSIQKLGPFQIFDTPSKRFILYEKVENSQCVPYFKVIDKATGDVLTDQPITNIRQTPTGIEISTKDGKTHSLDFSSENGIPKLAYNGGAPETLLSAQGKNGSFYYDPEKGQWFAENAQLLPLLDAFRQKGVSTQANPDGSVSSKPGINITNTNVGGDSNNPFNLPSLPENPLQLLLFIASIIAGIATIRVLATATRKREA